MLDSVYPSIPRALACILAVVLLLGCSDKSPDVEVALITNELGLPTAVTVLNKGRTSLSVEGFLMNGEFEVGEYVRGFFQSAGKLPVVVGEGEEIMFMTAPFSWNKTPTRVEIQIDGDWWEYEF